MLAAQISLAKSLVSSISSSCSPSAAAACSMSCYGPGVISLKNGRRSRNGNTEISEDVQWCGSCHLSTCARRALRTFTTDMLLAPGDVMDQREGDGGHGRFTIRMQCSANAKISLDRCWSFVINGRKTDELILWSL